MKKKASLLRLGLSLILLCAGLSSADIGQQGGLVFSGVSQNDLDGLEVLDKSKPPGDQFDFAGTNLFTLNFQNANAAKAKIDGSVDFWLLYGAYADAFNQSLTTPVVSIFQSQAAFIVDIRKLYASLYLPFADLSAGREIISFGEGMVFSPIDVFSAVNVLDLSLRRSGSDVARVRVPLGELTGVDCVAKLTSRDQGHTAAIKGYTHVGGFDLAGVGVYEGGTQREVITGLTFKGDLEAGVYGELVEHWRPGGNRAFIGMAGADYSIADAWYFTGEYLFNETPQPGATSSQLSILQTTVPLIHHNYGFLDARYKINDLMNLSASAIADISGRSGIFTGQYYYNILQNADVIVYVQYYPASTNGLLPQVVGEVTYGLRVEVSF